VPQQNSEHFLIFAQGLQQDCCCPCSPYKAGQGHKDKFNKWRKSWQQEPNPHLVRTVAEAVAKLLSKNQIKMVAATHLAEKNALLHILNDILPQPRGGQQISQGVLNGQIDRRAEKRRHYII
jgi:hypothetical protein